jgi:CrcB protein
MFQRIAWLSLAGACGTVSRYCVYELAKKANQAHLPIGTFAVNIIGSFLFGLIYVAAEHKFNFSAETRMILLVGFVGTFTTFSTFAFDTAQMLKAAQWLPAFGNVFGQIALGLLALIAGVLVGRAL